MNTLNAGAHGAMHLPLQGVKVIEVAQIMAGPVCGLMLADLGAEVIKVEKFPAGDDARHYQKPGDPAMPPSFCMINRGKRSIGINLQTEAGKDVLKRMVGQADILTENFRVGVMEKLGLSYEVLHAINPALIYTSITGYGRVGPMAHQGGFDLILQAFSGLIHATGETDGRPVKPGFSIADINAGILAAFGTLGAYIQRLKTGQGQRVDSSLLQAAMQQNYWLAATYFSTGQNTPRLGTAHALIAPYQVYQCADGGIAIGGANPNAWRRICDVLGHPEWQDDDRFATPQLRVRHQKALETLIEAELAHCSMAEWCQRLEAAGVPVGPVNTPGQALEHPQTRAAGMVIEVPGGMPGCQKSLGPAVTLNGQYGQTPATTAPPQVGQHSQQILRELGYGDDDIRDLLAGGAVGGAAGQV